MELSDPKIKKFLIFSQKKAFLIFRETETPTKIPYISRNGTFLYSGNGNIKKLPTFQEVTFRARKIKNPTPKKFFIFQEMELSSHKIRNFLIF